MLHRGIDGPVPNLDVGQQREELGIVPVGAPKLVDGSAQPNDIDLKGVAVGIR
jgi:hypothetical protein